MELRAAAEIADDDMLRTDFANGVDLHRQQAAAMHNIRSDEVTEAQRNAAKAINFGVIYGSGGAGLAASAWSGQRIVMTDEEAEEARDKFLKRYSALARWMRTHADECQRCGFIAIGKLGRVIEASWEAPQPGKRGRANEPLFGDADEMEDEGIDWDDLLSSSSGGAQQNCLRYTLCCNAPIQGACADVAMLAMISTDHALRDAHIDGGLVLSVHDELVIEVPEDRADEAAVLLQRCMESAFTEVFPQAPLAELVKLGRGLTWGEAK